MSIITKILITNKRDYIKKIDVYLNNLSIKLHVMVVFT